jgi:hypothetical protein
MDGFINLVENCASKVSNQCGFYWWNLAIKKEAAISDSFTDLRGALRVVGYMMASEWNADRESIRRTHADQSDSHRQARLAASRRIGSFESLGIQPGSGSSRSNFLSSASSSGPPPHVTYQLERAPATELSQYLSRPQPLLRAPCR